MVSALYIRKDSIYKTLGVDCWDIERDARKWPGGNPVIAHPPCRSWGNFSWRSKGNDQEKLLAFWAITAVTQWGGVLEHPVTSKLWKEGHLPLPGTFDQCGGYTICVNQHWWGHKAKKKTFLYIVGCPEKELPPIPMTLNAITHVVGFSRGQLKDPSGIKEVSRREREETPIELAKWLIKVAEMCRV